MNVNHPVYRVLNLLGLAVGIIFGGALSGQCAFFALTIITTEDPVTHLSLLLLLLASASMFPIIVILFWRKKRKRSVEAAEPVEKRTWEYRRFEPDPLRFLAWFGVFGFAALTAFTVYTNSGLGGGDTVIQDAHPGPTANPLPGATPAAPAAPARPVLGGGVQGTPLNLTGAVSTMQVVEVAGGAHSMAFFNQPRGIVIDGGNMYVADSENNRIRKVEISTGLVTTLAGSGAAGSADGAGTAAAFDTPRAIASDGANLYVTDGGNDTIRKIVIATGAVTTLAGKAGTSGSDDGTGASASFFYPRGIATDGANVYVADSGNNRIRKIVIATGAVTTLAGSGKTGHLDGTGMAASFAGPDGIATDGNNLYVADTYNHTIRKISISTREVISLAGYTKGSVDGTGTGASFNQPTGITSDGANLYVEDDGNNTIRKIVIATGAVTTLAGKAGRHANDRGSESTFHHPYGLAADRGNLYIADTQNHTLSKLAAGGTPAILAGNGEAGFADDGATPSAKPPLLSQPAGVTTDGKNLYIADSDQHTIRKIVIATGEISVLAGSSVPGFTDATGTAATFNQPAGITTDGSNLYVADSENHLIRKIVIATGAVSTLAGFGTPGSADGTGSSATFYRPFGITSDSANLYVTDIASHRIRKIVIATGAASTLAGAGSAGSLDGTGAAALFNDPSGITTDGSNLYVADSGNNTIRKIVLASGEVTTIAGSGTSGSLDGTGAAASFSEPRGITTDGTNLYVADSGNRRLRKIVLATGAVTTLAGASGPGDALGAGATFQLLQGIATDGKSLYVADSENHSIRIIK